MVSCVLAARSLCSSNRSASTQRSYRGVKGGVVLHYYLPGILFPASTGSPQLGNGAFSISAYRYSFSDGMRVEGGGISLLKFSGGRALLQFEDVGF